MRLQLLFLVVALIGFAAAHNDDTSACEDLNVNSQAACEDQCSECVCFFAQTGNSNDEDASCTCIDQGGNVAFACSDHALDDFWEASINNTFPSNDTGLVDGWFGDDTCVGDGVSSEDECQAMCDGCLCFFAHDDDADHDKKRRDLGDASCTCIDDAGDVAYVCSDIFAYYQADSGFGRNNHTHWHNHTRDDDDDDDHWWVDDDYNDDEEDDDDDDGFLGDADTFRDILVLFLGHECRPAVDAAVTDAFVDCVANADHLEAALDFAFGFTEAALGSVCEHECTRAIVTGMSVLASAGCINDDLGILSGEGFLGGAVSVGEHQHLLDVVCARGNNRYCGVTYGIVDGFLHTQQVTREQCEAVVDSGYCLGTVIAAARSGMILDGATDPSGGSSNGNVNVNPNGNSNNNGDVVVVIGGFSADATGTSNSDAVPLVDALNRACGELGVDGVTTAASGREQLAFSSFGSTTEDPGASSSAAIAVGGIVTATLAALFVAAA